MRRLVASGLVAATLGGCSYSTAKGAAIVGAGTVPAGLFLYAASAMLPQKSEGIIPRYEANPDYLYFVSLPGVTLMLCGLVGMKILDSPGEVVAHDRAIREARQADREALRAAIRARAWALTKEARAAAAANDCTTVARLDHDVYVMDAEFYGAVLEDDVAVQRCLAATASAP